MFDKEKFDWLARGTLPHVYYPLRFVKDLLEILLGWLNLPTNIWLNHSFGSRYLTPDRVIFALLSMNFFSSVSWMVLGFMTEFGMRRGPVGGHSFGLFSLAFLLMAAWQGWQNRNRPYYQHSRSFGIARLLPLLRVIAALLPLRTAGDGWLEERLNWLAYRLLHPLLVFGIGALVKGSFDPAFGLYLQISAFAIFIEAHFAYGERRNRYYDHLDALLDSFALQQMVEGKPTQPRLGVHAIPMPAQSLDMEPLGVEAMVRETMGYGEEATDDATDS